MTKEKPSVSESLKSVIIAARKAQTDLEIARNEKRRAEELIDDALKNWKKIASDLKNIAWESHPGKKKDDLSFGLLIPRLIHIPEVGVFYIRLDCDYMEKPDQFLQQIPMEVYQNESKGTDPKASGVRS